MGLPCLSSLSTASGLGRQSVLTKNPGPNRLIDGNAATSKTISSATSIRMMVKALAVAAMPRIVSPCDAGPVAVKDVGDGGVAPPTFSTAIGSSEGMFCESGDDI